jgi:hypothetical protein
MNDHRSARPAHRLGAARQHLEEAERELRQVRDQAEAGGDWHRLLEAALAHLSEMDRLLLDAEQRMPEDSGSSDPPA